MDGIPIGFGLSNQLTAFVTKYFFMSSLTHQIEEFLQSPPESTVDILSRYLGQCRVTNQLVESDGAHVPPTAEEVKELIEYLKSFGIKPAIVGSVGILHHMGPKTDIRKDFRPTVDLDVWVTRVPEPPEGWRKDRESIGVSSWISPSGGYVDFLEAGQEFEGGSVIPQSIEYDTKSDPNFPVAHWLTILRMKLNSMRSKDLSDSIALVRSMGGVPSAKELGKLSQTQKENLDLVTQWFKLRPVGTYGE